MKKMISKRAKDYHSDSESKGSDQSFMIKKNLNTMIDEAKKLLSHIKEGDTIPEWCHEKITTSASDLDSVFEYLMFSNES
jgi:hypothetical protein